MNEELLERRLAERRLCEAKHVDLRVPDNGLGWVGSRCPQCGFRFFGAWEPNWQPNTAPHSTLRTQQKLSP